MYKICQHSSDTTAAVKESKWRCGFITFNKINKEQDSRISKEQKLSENTVHKHTAGRWHNYLCIHLPDGVFYSRFLSKGRDSVILVQITEEKYAIANWDHSAHCDKFQFSHAC